MSERIIIYTDGSCLSNGTSSAVGGWAYKIIYPDGKVLTDSGADFGVTNNQMEMRSVLNALQAIELKGDPVTVYSDSQYVIKTLNGQFQIHKNQSHWKVLIHEVRKFSDIEFKWVKGHDKNEHNNEVDNLAVKASTALQNSLGQIY